MRPLTKMHVHGQRKMSCGKPATVDPGAEECVDLHTPHWHGNTVTAMGMATAGFRLFWHALSGMRPLSGNRLSMIVLQLETVTLGN